MGNEFKTQIIARSKYGKTVLLMEHLRDLVAQKLIKPKRLIIFSSTIRSDPPQLEFVRDMKQMYNDYKNDNTFEAVDMDLIHKIYNTNKQLKENGKRYH